MFVGGLAGFKPTNTNFAGQSKAPMGGGKGRGNAVGGGSNGMAGGGNNRGSPMHMGGQGLKSPMGGQPAWGQQSPQHQNKSPMGAQPAWQQSPQHKPNYSCEFFFDNDHILMCDSVNCHNYTVQPCVEK